VSSKKYATPLRLEIKSSKLLFSFLLFSHLLAAGIVIYLNIDKLLTALLVTLIYWSAYTTISKHAWKKSSNAIVGLVWDANDEWFLKFKSGEEITARLHGESFTHPMLTVLNFRSQGVVYETQEKPPLYAKLHPGYSVIILKDNVDKNDFRRLRTRLKISKHESN